MGKKKLDDLTKIKLIYSGELIIIAIVVLIIGILQLTSLLAIKDLFRRIFNWVTIFGSPILIITSIYSLISPKRRKKISIFDKITLFPVAIYIIVIDIICFINEGALEQSFYQTYIPIALISVAIIYIAQGIYHWFYPLPSLLEDLEQERIDKITFKVITKYEDGSAKCLHIQSKKEYLFKDVNIVENENELFCLDQYPNATYEEINNESK